MTRTTGWAVRDGPPGTISLSLWRTTDAGAHWTDVTPVGDDAIRADGIFDGTTAWLAAPRGNGTMTIYHNDFCLFPRSYEATRLLNQEGLKAIVLTNQTHVGSGDITIGQVNASFQRLQSNLWGHGAHLDGWSICPHLPEDDCACREPSPHLLLKAAAELDLDMSRSYVVGDVGPSDTLAGVAAGCRTILVKTGWGTNSLGPDRHLWAGTEPDSIADDCLEAAQWIIGREGSGPTR